MTEELYVRIQQEFVNHWKLCFLPTKPPGTLVDMMNAMSAHSVRLCEEYKRICWLLANPAAAVEYLHSKGLRSYGDLSDMHDRIVGHVMETSPERQDEMFAKLVEGGDEPEFRGSGRAFFNVLDFLVAIPHIPHTSDPQQPTTLGLLLSASQSVFRDKRFFISVTSHHDLMHLLLTHGVGLSGTARTTTGEIIGESCREQWPGEGRRFKADSFIFDSFNVTNAIAFHPEQVLLSVKPMDSWLSSVSNYPPSFQVVYNVFESGRGVFVLPPDAQIDMENSISPSRNFSPEFLRIMRGFIG